MTRKPDEIKKGLECCMDYQICTEGEDPQCPYYDVKRCMEALLADALALIQQLQAENAEKAERIQQLESELDAMKDEIDRDCETCKNSGTCQEEGYCMWCENKESNKTPCCNCVYGCNWEWRGVQKEE